MSAEAEVCEGSEIELQGKSEVADILVGGEDNRLRIGDIFCTDPTRGNRDTIVRAGAYRGSDLVAQGIVFFVDASGRHGWMIGLQSVVDAKWREGAQQGEVINGIVNHTTTWTAMKDTMGYTNTRLIRAMGNAAEYPAAYAVDFANGWYLPALGQLYYMMSHMAVLNNSLSVVGAQPLPVSAGSVTDDSYYWWSSSVHSMAHAWRLSNGNLELGIASKTFHYYITPVKTF